MATKKPAPKKVAKPVKKVVPAKKAVPAKKSVPAKPAAKAAAKKVAKPIAKPVKKAAPAKKVVPVKKAAPIKKAAPAKKVIPTPKAVAKAPVKKVAVAKPISKPAKKDTAKPVSKKTEKVVAAPISKPMAKAEEKPATPQKIIKTPPMKRSAMKMPSKTLVKVSGIEKSTTVIPMRQLPMKKKEEPIKDVKIPKTNIKTSVPYNPTYTSLEKRFEKAKPSDPLVRYSDNDLTDFRDLINKKLDSAKKELAYLQGLITRKDETGGDNDDGRYMTMEDGSLSMEREQLSQMASRQITYIDHLEKAIMRIENKTYGICRVTGKLIDKARLRAVPHATLSLEAKLGLVRPSSGD